MGSGKENRSLICQFYYSMLPKNKRYEATLQNIYMTLLWVIYTTDLGSIVLLC